MGWLTRWVIAACVLSAAPAVAADHAGAGTAGVSGYEVTDLRFIPSRQAPDVVERVTFRLDGDANFARVSLGGRTGWFDCERSRAMVWRCPLPGIPVDQIVQTRVVAAQN